MPSEPRAAEVEVLFQTQGILGRINFFAAVELKRKETTTIDQVTDRCQSQGRGESRLL